MVKEGTLKTEWAIDAPADQTQIFGKSSGLYVSSFCPPWNMPVKCYWDGSKNHRTLPDTHGCRATLGWIGIRCDANVKSADLWVNRADFQRRK